MNSRERFHATFGYDQPDRVFLMSQWTFSFSPMVDHSVPPDVPFEHFKYYMNLIHEVCTFA